MTPSLGAKLHWLRRRRVRAPEKPLRDESLRIERLEESTAPTRGVGPVTHELAAGAAFRDRPTIFGALVIAGAVATAFLLVRRFATGVPETLDDAATGHERLETELAAVREAKEEFRSLAYHDDPTGLPNRSLGAE